MLILLCQLLYIIRLRAVSLFSWSVEQNPRDTQMTTRVTEGAALVSRVLRLRHSTLACACTLLTKSGEKERLLAVLYIMRELPCKIYTQKVELANGTYLENLLSYKILI